jgi:AmiR/NasT family two-component response regulator
MSGQLHESPQAEGLQGRVAELEGANVRLTREIENLRAARVNAAVIEQAKGIIMRSMGCSAGEAFDKLVEQSQHENRKLSAVARELVARQARP